jgi:hypothetical protein
VSRETPTSTGTAGRLKAEAKLSSCCEKTKSEKSVPYHITS